MHQPSMMPKTETIGGDVAEEWSTPLPPVTGKKTLPWR